MSALLLQAQLGWLLAGDPAQHPSCQHRVGAQQEVATGRQAQVQLRETRLQRHMHHHMHHNTCYRRGKHAGAASMCATAATSTHTWQQHHTIITPHNWRQSIIRLYGGAHRAAAPAPPTKLPNTRIHARAHTRARTRQRHITRVDAEPVARGSQVPRSHHLARTLQAAPSACPAHTGSACRATGGVKSPPRHTVCIPEQACRCC